MAENKDDLFEMGMEDLSDLQYIEELKEPETPETPKEEIDNIENEITDDPKPIEEPPVEEPEEEAEVEEESVVSETEDTDEEGASPHDIFSSFASALVDGGALSSLKEEDLKNIKSTKDLVEAIEKEVKSREQDYYQAVMDGLPVEDLKQTKKTLESLKEIKDSDLENNEELRKNLIINDFISKGISPERAEKFAQRSFDLAADLDDAKEALANLTALEQENIKKAIDARKQEIENSKKEQEKRLNDLKALIYDEKKELIPGVAFNRNTADEIYKSITTAVDVTEEGRPINEVAKARRENPVQFDYILHTLFKLSKGFTDFSKITTSTTKRKAAKDFEEKLKLNSLQRFNDSGISRTGSDNFEDVLDHLDKQM